MVKTLPKELTSYDLLKAFAIILMITDHVGHHFYPDEMWFRVLGRLCIPIWFFLIGYARTTEVPWRFWIGGLIVAVSGIIAGQFLLPLNILFTIIVLRLLRQGVVSRAFYSAETLRGMFLIFIFLIFPTSVIFEYGSSAMLFVLVGYIVRNREEVSKNIEFKYLKIYTVLSFITFFIIQGVIMPSVSPVQAAILFCGFMAIGGVLWNFQPATYIDAQYYMAPSIIRLVQFMGRRTLEIYVAHILLFRAICMYLYPEHYVFMEWQYVPHSVVSMFLYVR